MTHRFALSICAVACATASFSKFAAAEDLDHPTGLHIANRIAGPDGGWDYANFDPARRRVYVAHSDAVIAINADTGKADFNFAKGSHFHSAVPVPGTDLIVTTDGGDNTTKLIAAADGHEIAAFPTEHADGAQYDPKTGQIVVIQGDAGKLTLIDPRAMKLVATISIGDHLEFGAPDGKGLFYVNLSDKNEVAVVDLAAGKILRRFGLPGCTSPTGLAYVADDRVISTCVNGGIDILDARSGRVLAAFMRGGFADAVIYDPERKLAFVPDALDGTLLAIALSGPANNTIIDTIPTQIGAHTGAVDPKTGRVYLPTAELILPVPPGQEVPSNKPGTFVVLVLDRNIIPR